jgi:hypothetical protein
MILPDDMTKLSHEHFGHLNYESLQQLCKQNMVTSLPILSCKDGVFSSCVIGKHHQDSFDNHASAPL